MTIPREIISLVPPEIIAYEYRRLPIPPSSFCPLLQKTLRLFSLDCASSAGLSVNANCVMAFVVPLKGGARWGVSTILEHLLVTSARNIAKNDTQALLPQKIRLEQPWWCVLGLKSAAPILRDPESGINVLHLLAGQLKSFAHNERETVRFFFRIFF